MVVCTEVSCNWKYKKENEVSNHLLTSKQFLISRGRRTTTVALKLSTNPKYMNLDPLIFLFWFLSQFCFFLSIRKKNQQSYFWRNQNLILGLGWLYVRRQLLLSLHSWYCSPTKYVMCIVFLSKAFRCNKSNVEQIIVTLLKQKKLIMVVLVSTTGL